MVIKFRPHDTDVEGSYARLPDIASSTFDSKHVAHISRAHSTGLPFRGHQSPASPFDVDFTSDSSIECHLRLMTSSPFMSNGMMRRQSIMSEAMAPSLSEGSSALSPSSIPNTPMYSGAAQSFQSSVCATPKLADADLWPHEFASNASVTFCPLLAEATTMQNAMVQTPFTPMSTYLDSTMAHQQGQYHLLHQQFSHPSNWTGGNHGADGFIQAISPSELHRPSQDPSCHGPWQHQSLIESPIIQDEIFANTFALCRQPNDMVNIGTTSGVVHGAINVTPETLLQSIPVDMTSSENHVPTDDVRPRRKGVRRGSSSGMSRTVIGHLAQHKTPRSMHGCPKCEYKCSRKEHLSRHTRTKHDCDKLGFCYASICIDRDPQSPFFGGPKRFSRKDNSRDHMAGHLHLTKEQSDGNDVDGDLLVPTKGRNKRKAKKRATEVHPQVLFDEIREGFGPECQAKAELEVRYLIRRAQLAADKSPVVRQWLRDNQLDEDIAKPVKKAKRTTPLEEFSVSSTCMTPEPATISRSRSRRSAIVRSKL